MDSKWIRTENKLPTVDDNVIAYITRLTDNFSYVHQLLYEKGEWWWWDDYIVDSDDYEVTYWMPLPEPPKED